MKRNQKQYIISIKKQIIDHYGKICECCNENNINILNIDHIGGGGRQHRAATSKRGGYNFYLWLRKNDYPKGFRVLCSNCNMCNGHHGFCPHQCKKSEFCQFCNIPLNNDNYIEFYKKYSINICIQCVFKFSSKKDILTKKWIKDKKLSLLYKELVIKKYGNICKICNETNPLFLTIDHINGGGNKERSSGKIGQVFYRYLNQIDYSTDYQILCYNCNSVKEYYIRQQTNNIQENTNDK